MGKKRKKISRQVKETVYARQKGKCVCCLNPGVHMHHIDPVTLNGKNFSQNIIILCKKHHNLLHLADPETCMQIFEYGYYINMGSLPDDPYSMITSQEVLDIIRNCY